MTLRPSWYSKIEGAQRHGVASGEPAAAPRTLLKVLEIGAADLV
jgi:hypothetical protein